MSCPKHVLLVDSSAGSQHLVDQLADTSWTLHLATSVRQALDLSRRLDILVGLIVVSEETVFWSDLPSLFSSALPLEWIGLVRASTIADARCRDLVARHFHDFHTAPFDRERLLFSIGHAHGIAALRKSVERQALPDDGTHQMVGASPAMKAALRDIRKIARVDAAVLIKGESGTGKELAAHAIHAQSARKDGPFVPINCGALPSNLIQSELFGHEKGAFTGANEAKKGLIEAADTGTLFLDEIGDLPLDLQANLLRFLQEGTIQPIGSRRQVKVDVRIIAATHVDLEKAIGSGKFRQDLFFRLNVLHLALPPLRERTEDIDALARFFFDRFAGERAGCVKGFSDRALLAMRTYHWPGNVRELINRVRRAVVMTENRLITPSDLGLSLAEPAPVRSLQEARQRAEYEAITRCLHHTCGNLSQAAKRLGISRMTLYRLMDKYALVDEPVNGCAP